MPERVLCIYTLPAKEEAHRRNFVSLWGEEKAYDFWETLHKDLLSENRSGDLWDLWVMTSNDAAKKQIKKLCPQGTRIHAWPETGQWGLAKVFEKLSRNYEKIVIAAGDLPGLTRERVCQVFEALDRGARMAFLRERENRFSAIGVNGWEPWLMDFDLQGGGKFWEYIAWLEKKGVKVYWQEERVDDLPGPEWVVPVLGFATRRLLPSMENWHVDVPPQPELVLIARLPYPGKVKMELAEELSSLEGGPDPERAKVIAASVYKAVLFDRMDFHRGRPEYRCVGAFPLKECGRGELAGFPEVFHPLPELGSMECWLRDALCDLDEDAPRIVSASDVPYLSHEAVMRAFSMLRESHVVLGPSHDGDYNLMGMSVFHDIFAPELFESGNALESVSRLLGRKGIPFGILDGTLRDLTTLEDLVWFKENAAMDESPRLRRLLDSLSPELGF